LHAIGRKGCPPTPPLRLGDYAGGGLYLALGLLAGIIEARQSGKGQAIDTAIVDGTASLLTSFYGLHAAGLLSLERGTNTLDSGAFYYDVYECADGKWVSVAPMEGRFRVEFFRRIGVDPAELGDQADRANWDHARAVVARTLRQKTREEWCGLLEGTDACFAPVLTLVEAPGHEHLKARNTFVEVDGVVQPVPAPRFSRTVPPKPTPPETPDPQRALDGWLPAATVGQLIAEGVL